MSTTVETSVSYQTTAYYPLDAFVVQKNNISAIASLYDC